jgi:hypothetical protein
MFKKFFKKINESLKDNNNKTSHTRISSYIILASILFTSVFILGTIEIVNAITQWKLGVVYTIPSQHVTLFGMLLGHHLLLLGIKKVSDKPTEPLVLTKEVIKDLGEDLLDGDDESDNV